MLFVAVLFVAFAGSSVYEGGCEDTSGEPCDLGSEEGVDAKKKSCTLNLQEQTDPYMEPLILGVNTTSGKTTYDFIYPTPVDEEGVLTVASGSKLLLACPMAEYGNYQATSGNEEAYAICKDGSLTINGTAVSTASTSCGKTYAYSWLNVTEESCGSGDNVGIIVQLGFQLDDLDESYFPLAYSCFVIDRAVTLWSHNQLMGGSVDGRVRCSESRSFEKGPSKLFPVVNPETYYVKTEQIVTLNALLGDGGADMYISDDNSFNRGHLAPHADFIFNSHRLMSYYYVNAQPQWYSFNAGNWLMIENFTRSIATDVGITVNIWTGTYGILELANTSGVKTKIYLDPVDMLLPAPEVYWKLVQNPQTQDCTVAIGVNNPFLTSAPKSLCKKVKPYGWPTLTGNLTYGYTYYCNYKTFKKVVDYAPDITCDGLFEFPK